MELPQVLIKLIALSIYPLYVPGKTVVPVGGRVMFKNGACAQKGKDGRFKIFKGLSKEELAKLRKKRGKK